MVKASGFIISFIALAAAYSCASAPSSGSLDGDTGTAGGMAGGALVAGLLLDSKEARRVPARKPRAMLAIASPRVLGKAIGMGVLEDKGYPTWRLSRSEALFDVVKVRIGFSARLPEGGVERQSGMLSIPAPSGGGRRELSWIVFLKGSEHHRDKVPSRRGANESALMDAAAALGYAVWAPDYAGMGDAEGAQEYCVPESMAASALDGLAAARAYLADRGDEYAESGRLYIIGYSQGGIATMASLKAATGGDIPIPGLRIVAAYPLGAPLDLMPGIPFLADDGVTVERPDFAVLLAIGWSRAYPASVKLDEILSELAIERVVPLFDGTRDTDELLWKLSKALGRKAGEVRDIDLYAPAYRTAIAEDPSSSAFFSAQEKARLDRWAPPQGLRLVLAAAPSDELVPFETSARAYEWIKAEDAEADVSLVRLESQSHGLAAVEGLLYALIDLDTIEGGEGL
ncbi:MAG TPA: alpha/beta fold hydrolase [Spirochaetales bacterium]|nr:alpha/beta fold hydrolase [Spirochaetales bacterium]